MELAGLKLDTERLGAISTLVKEEADDLEQQIYELQVRSSRSDRPNSLRRSCLPSLGSHANAAARLASAPTPRVLQAIRDEHPIIPRSSAGAS